MSVIQMRKFYANPRSYRESVPSYVGTLRSTAHKPAPQLKCAFLEASLSNLTFLKYVVPRPPGANRSNVLHVDLHVESSRFRRAQLHRGPSVPRRSSILYGVLCCPPWP